MKEKILTTISVIVLIAVGFFIGTIAVNKTSSVLGGLATGQTAKYSVASSSVYSISGVMTALASSTSKTRDYISMTAVSGTAYCLMRNGSAASASDYSFVLSSSTPRFEMVEGVYQGRISCTGTAIFSVVEANL